jgi:hypothetical protein
VAIDELDFVKEAAHQQAVAANLANARVDVKVPRITSLDGIELVTRRVIVMEYVAFSLSPHTAYRVCRTCHRRYCVCNHGHLADQLGVWRARKHLRGHGRMTLPCYPTTVAHGPTDCGMIVLPCHSATVTMASLHSPWHPVSVISIVLHLLPPLWATRSHCLRPLAS